MKRLLVPCLALGLSGCAVFKPAQRDWENSPYLPDAFSQEQTSTVNSNAWWTLFESDELDRLVTQALTNNLDLVAAFARLDQAQATAVKSGAARWPTLSGSAGASKSERQVFSAEQGLVTRETESYSAGLAASFELDVWGRVKSLHEAGRLQRDASADDLRAAATTVSAEVTLRWLELIRQRQVLDLLNTQLENNEKVLELTELRFSKSSATALDVLQQRDTVARVRTLFPSERAQEQTLQHELAVLLGRPPRSDLVLTARSFPALPELPATGLPIELLQRRPDLRAAAQRLQAAEWNVASARADRLPSLRLSGSIGYSAEEYGSLLDNSVNQIAADLLGPLLEGGARKAEVARTRALVEEQLAAYHKLVLGAVQEVEDALVNEREQGALVQALQERLESAAMTSEESMARYQKGLNDFLPVLAAQTAEQETERALVQAQYQRLAARVQLHRALGGDWMDAALQTPAEGE